MNLSAKTYVTTSRGVVQNTPGDKFHFSSAESLGDPRPGTLGQPVSDRPRHEPIGRLAPLSHSLPAKRKLSVWARVGLWRAVAPQTDRLADERPGDDGAHLRSASTWPHSRAPLGSGSRPSLLDPRLKPAARRPLGQDSPNKPYDPNSGVSSCTDRRRREPPSDCGGRKGRFTERGSDPCGQDSSSPVTKLDKLGRAQRKTPLYAGSVDSTAD